MNFLNNLLAYFEDIQYVIPIILISLTFHECAHGFIAYKLGDPTAKDEGRLTLNPLKHIDIFGFLTMIVLRFGWAKPVPVNPMYFRNPRKGMLFTAAAGPVSNLILALFGSFFAVFFFYAQLIRESQLLGVFYTFFLLFSFLNIGLAVFNLIPVYPLDGSRILGYFLPNSLNKFFNDYGNYIYIAFFVLVLSTDFISDAIYFVQSNLFSLLAMLWQYPAFALANLLF